MEDAKAAMDFRKSEAGKALRDDEADFIDTSKMIILSVDEKVST
ncbi:hypothetical protein ACFLX5_00975 [Chloroflexota bacterium]